jgi:hypothetical protein
MSQTYYRVISIRRSWRRRFWTHNAYVCTQSSSLNMLNVPYMSKQLICTLSPENWWARNLSLTNTMKIVWQQKKHFKLTAHRGQWVLRASFLRFRRSLRCTRCVFHLCGQSGCLPYSCQKINLGWDIYILFISAALTRSITCIMATLKISYYKVIK